MNLDFEFTLRGGRPVRIRTKMCAPEPEVGINGWWADELWAEDENGEIVDLDQVDDDAASDQASQIAGDRDSDEDWF